TRPAQDTRATETLGPTDSDTRRDAAAAAATGRSAPTRDRACSVSGTVAYTPSEDNAMNANASEGNRRSTISLVGLATSTATNTNPRAQPGVPGAATVTSTTPPGAKAAARTANDRSLAMSAPAARRNTATSSAPGSTSSAAKPANAATTTATPSAIDRVVPRAMTTATSETPIAVSNETAKPELLRRIISPSITLSPVKIAHLTTVDLSLRFLVLAQLVALRDEGHEVIGISSPGPWVADLERLGIRHIPLESSTRDASVGADVRSALDLWRVLRRERPDVLHTHNPKPGVYGRIVGRMASVPIVVNTVHGLYATTDDALT